MNEEARNFIPFGKPDFGEDEIEAVARVLRSGWVGMGPETIAFEKELSEFIGAPYVVAVNSCTSALFLSLMVVGVGPGDEVVCPSLTWCSTANAALYLGAKPVFCDVDKKTLSVDADHIQEVITERTKAVIVVHMGGYAVDVERLRRALPSRVAIVEDAAHALGSRYSSGGMVGSSGNLTCFSFYANKNLSTGDGGAIALFDEELYDRLSSLRQNGLVSNAWKRYMNPGSILFPGFNEVGFKMNYTDLQACIARVQLRRQPDFRRLRYSIACNYHERLSEALPGIVFQKGILDSGHARHLVVIRLPVGDMNEGRDEILVRLRDRRIGASIHYPPLHRMRIYSHDGGRLPNTEELYSEIITLPIGGSMTMDDVDYVIENMIALVGLEA